MKTEAELIAMLTGCRGWDRLNEDRRKRVILQLRLCLEIDATPLGGRKAAFDRLAAEHGPGISAPNLKKLHRTKWREGDPCALVHYAGLVKTPAARPEERRREKILGLKAKIAALQTQLAALEAGEPLRDKRRAKGLPLGGVRTKKTEREKLEAERTRFARLKAAVDRRNESYEAKLLNERARIARLKNTAQKRSASYGAKIAEIDAKLPPN